MRRLPALVLAGVLALAGCSDDAPPDDEAPPSADPCANQQVLPDECVGTLAPTAPATPVASTSADYPPLTLPREPRELARGGNDNDPALRTITLRGTVPAGARLKIEAACEGVGTLKVTTQPLSNAEVEFGCGFEGRPYTIGVEDDKFAKAPTAYAVTVQAPPSARWFVTVSSTTEATPAPEA